MDDRRFDGLARMVAHRRSRRGVVRGLAGVVALVAAGRSAAPVAAQAPGEPCYHDAQCVWDFGQEHFCADNGFDYDGPLNCCTYGGRCTRDEACCGAARCIDGFCTDRPRFAGSGDRCDAGVECRAADTSLTCAYNADTGDDRCCAGEGGRCAWDGGCCGYLRCGDAGFCVSVPRPGGCPAYLCPCDPNFNQCEPGLGCCPSEIGFVCAPWCYGG